MLLAERAFSLDATNPLCDQACLTHLHYLSDMQASARVTSDVIQLNRTAVFSHINTGKHTGFYPITFQWRNSY